MEWIEISLVVDPPAASTVADLLQDFGHQGVSIEHIGIMPDSWDDGDVPPPEKVCVRAYMPDDEWFNARKHELETAFTQLSQISGIPSLVFSKVDENNWAEAWKAHYHPLRVGKRTLVHPRWIEVQPAPNDIVISMDPGMAFGTGTHPTTQLCLEALEDCVQHGSRVLDLGCGSGILAIAAAKLGATDILAIDNDPIAVRSTQENADINGVAVQITSQTGSLESVLHSARRFDLVVVNILTRVIIEMCKQGLGQTVRPSGHAIFSGLIEEQAEDVENALHQTGLKPYARRNMGDWVVIEAARPHA